MQEPKMRVLVISPQHWGTMRVTKHHYAIELAKLGHEVIFLEPTEANWNWTKSSFILRQSDASGVRLLNQQLNIPYNLKFHAKGLYDWFVKIHIRKLEKIVGPFDLVWSFDLTNAMPLKFFSESSKKIFFAADWPQVSDAVKAVEGASLLVSVAQEILNEYPNNSQMKKLLIDHGVADIFIEEGKKPFVKTDDKIRIGMSGNFLRPEINRATLLEIVYSNPDFLFELFGSYTLSNLGCEMDNNTSEFLNKLSGTSNVILHGMLETKQLAKELRRMDAFLICYDVQKDQSKGTNYHKVMEFLCYGKIIISNQVSAYKNNPLVIQTKNEFGVVDVLTNFQANKNLILENKRKPTKIYSYSTWLKKILFQIR
jgi:hypothetical protein